VATEIVINAHLRARPGLRGGGVAKGVMVIGEAPGPEEA